MSLTPDRRRVLALGLALPAALALPRGAWAAERPTGDIPMGDPDAPVTVIEYASFTCPHCATFHTETWPQVKENYVDTGKVRFILREVYFDPYGLWAAMVARCGGEGPYHAIVSQLMKQQDSWTAAEDRAGALQRIGRANGLSSDEMRACLQDRDYAEALVERYKETAGADEVTSTPTFVINGQVERGTMPYEEFAAILDKHLAEAS
jgi:protein-disulfide isomerase